MKKIILLMISLVVLFAQRSNTGKKFELKNLDKNADMHYITSGNIDKDPQDEIILLSSGSEKIIYAVDGVRGNLEWQSEKFVSVANYSWKRRLKRYQVRLQDLDGDNMMEVIILGTSNYDNEEKLHVYDADY